MSQGNMMKFIPVEASKWGEMVQAMTRVKELEEVLANLKAERDQFKEEVERLNSELHTCSCANANMHKYKAENARLKAEVERLTNTSTNADRFLISGLEQDVAILKAEVERLTKAGDAMYNEMLYPKHPDLSVTDAWNAAKGVQS